jgi:glycosyltransferase involved in cell wall biosynthesis
MAGDDSRRGGGQKTPMQRVLFVHNNFPGQFGDLAQSLIARGVRCVAFGQHHAPGLPEIPMLRYNVKRGTTFGQFPLVIRAEADAIRGELTARAARKAQSEGFQPDVIVGHTGWGETLFLREIWPQARQVLFPEFFYRGGLDVGFDPEFKGMEENDLLRLKAKNMSMALALSDADVIVCPTEFQASIMPDVFKPRIRVIHEGVDTEALKPGPAEPFALDDGRFIAPGTPVVTHVNHNLEPLRGMHIFARALPRLLAEVPQAQVLIMGRELKGGYGGAAPEKLTWKEICLRGVELDPERVHFLGEVPHDRMVAALRLSAAHVYYTYPFVLSWSAIEAMALGCYVIGSDTPPLHDAIENGVNGRLLPFFDVPALSEALIAACRDPAASAPLRRAARRTAVDKFSRAGGRARWFDILGSLGLRIPPEPAEAPAASD